MQYNEHSKTKLKGLKILQAKDELHRLVEALPKREISAAKRYLEFLLSQKTEKEVWAKFLEDPSTVDEPLDKEDLTAIEEAVEDIAHGRLKPWEQVKKELDL